VLATEQMPARWLNGSCRSNLGPIGFLIVANLVFLVLRLPARHDHLLLVMVPLLLPVARAWEWTSCTSASVIVVT